MDIKEGSSTKAFRYNFMVESLDSIRASSKFNDELNEVLLAIKVILVEGADDKIACKLSLEKLGVDLDKSNISVIDCGGIKNLKPIAEILKGFGIEPYALVDEETW